MIPTQTVSVLPTLSFILMVLGVLVFTVAIPSVRRALHARIGSMKTYFYHDSELVPPVQGSEPSGASSSAPRSLLEQIEPSNWDYEIYRPKDSSNVSQS